MSCLYQRQHADMELERFVMKIKSGSKVYFLGVAGTGMASVAGLAKAAGYQVSGVDKDLYPPMSTMLEELKIPVLTPYGAGNLDKVQPDLVVVANALSRGNEELEHMLNKGFPYTSFPQFLGDYFLEKRTSLVVSGTHGKTTTTSVLAHVLTELGEDPGFMIGGIPRNFTYSFNLGTGAVFVIEGDEYDTAFFDKGSKFLHYRPKHLILNNLEYDHADIFPNLEAIEAQFSKLISLVPHLKNVIANVDDAGILNLLKKLGLEKEVFTVSTLGRTADAKVRVLAKGPASMPAAGGKPQWQAEIACPDWGVIKLKTTLTGEHNIANIAQVLAALTTLSRDGVLKKHSVEEIVRAFATFKGVTRRLDHLASGGGVDVYEDFAHHPTAVRLVIEGFRKTNPGKRLLVAFDPRNATSRRNVFTDQFAQSLSLADKVFVGKCTVDQRIPEMQRMDTSVLQQRIGTHATSYDDNEILLSDITNEARAGDAVIFMSSGSFSGIQYRLAEVIRERG